MSNSQPTEAPKLGAPHEVQWSINSLAWVPESLCASRLSGIDATHMRHESFSVERPDSDLTAIGEPLIVRHAVGRTTSVLMVGSVLALVSVGGGSAYVEAAGPIKRPLTAPLRSSPTIWEPQLMTRLWCP